MANETSEFNIKQLDPYTIRRICSGQVIVSMAAAVKELIENSIDAGGTYICIRFGNYGKDHIEVIDNGSGIEESNFELLGQRNCTSKLLTFDHLNLVETFGFRGEALNSLCNLSNVKIHTRHSSTDMGTVLTFDTNGRIIDKVQKAREVGTTITLSKFFEPLPVRRKEFLLNFRRSFDKTLSIIYQYCLGLTGLKIVCEHMKPDSHTYSTIFINNGTSIQSNIVDIFDFKQFSQLMPFICHKDISDDDSSTDFDFNINGFISKPDTGCGRNTSERQFFYINGRPCDLPNVCKKINQFYKTFNRNQYPFILLKINIDEKLVDRNLTSDKRKILLSDDHLIIKVIQHSLEKMFSPDDNELISVSQSNLSSFLKRAIDEKNSDSDDSLPNKLVKLDSRTNLSSIENNSVISDNENNKMSPKLSTTTIKPGILEIKMPEKPLMHPFFQNLPNEKIHWKNVPEKLNSSKKTIDDSVESRLNSIEKNSYSSNNNNVSPNNYNQKRNELIVENNGLKEKNHFQVDNVIVDDEDNESQIIASRNTQTVNVTIDEICQQYNDYCVHQENIDKNFQTNIIPEEDNEQALNQLKHVLSKQSFDEMRIIGQFNLGFIIAKLKNDLFIIDQHAIDERFNFEKLLENPPISYQNLVCPLNLKLSAINEMIIFDHIDIFRQFGFGIQIDPDADDGLRLILTKIPIGKEWIGGKADLEELAEAIRGSSADCFQSANFIFSGLKREIAYRACRSSVMIGEVLSAIQMKKLLCQMVNVKDPWHCAHNRPTIRHLIFL